MRILLFAVWGLAVFPSAAVEIDAAWRIVVPPREDSGVQRALKDMADELASAFEEGAGFKPGVDEGGPVGPKRIFFGQAFAEAAGFDLSSFRAMDNAYAEKDGAVYLFGNDRSGKPNLKNVGWQNMYLPSARPRRAS